MQDVLQKLPYYKCDNKDIAELLPQNWEIAKSTTIRTNSTDSAPIVANSPDSEK